MKDISWRLRLSGEVDINDNCYNDPIFQSYLPGEAGLHGPRLGAVVLSGASRDKLNSGVLTKTRTGQTSPHTLMGRYIGIYNIYWGSPQKIGATDPELGGGYSGQLTLSD